MSGDSYEGPWRTDRLIIRRQTLEDAEFQLELLNSPGWLENIGDRNVHTVAEAKEYIKTKVFPQLEEIGVSNNVILLADTGEKIGVCGIYCRPGLDIPDLGFALLGDYCGHGYAKEAAAKIAQLARTTWKFKELSAITTHSNIGSQKVLEHLGFIHTKDVNLPNDPETLRYYYLKL